MTNIDGIEGDLKKGLDYLKSLGPKEIILFGSLAEGNSDSHSDIDLAVSGITPIQYFTAVAEISSIVGRRVDLVYLGHVSPKFESMIRKRGKVLYAA